MGRFALELSYDGSDYHGWQIQENARTVQGVLTEALQQILQEEIKLSGCGRTDTGVHASHYITHFDVHDIADDFLENLNQILPEDINIEQIFSVPEKFHARYSALSRTYQYRITSQKPVFNHHLVYYDRRLYDLSAMNAACELILRTTDFGAFRKIKGGNKTNICQVKTARWSKTDRGLLFTVVSDRFLRNMVRAMVGTMLELGRKKITLSDFETILASSNRTYAGPSAPAKGLILSYVEYDRTEWVSVC